MHIRPYRWYPQIYLVLLFCLLASACQAKASPPSIASPSPSPTPSPLPTQRNELGLLRREETGGYVYQPIPGYQIAASNGVVSMLEEGADPRFGPSLTLYGGIPEAGTTAQSLLDQLKDEPDTRLSEPEPVKIGGAEGLTAEIIILVNGIELHGRIAMVVTAETQFVALAAAPQSRWEGDLDFWFETVMDSIRFFPRPLTPEATVKPVETP